MKAAINGVLNVSILDGWWAEAYSAEMGWAIGRGEEYDDHALQDEVEGKALYDLLEREIIPLFYSRGMDGLPREWIRKMKASMREVGRNYSSTRMLLEYHERFYARAMQNARDLRENNCALCRDMAGYLQKLRGSWSALRIDGISSPSAHILKIGEAVTVTARVFLAGLAPEEVAVELFYGPLSSQDEIGEPRRREMSPCGKEGRSRSTRPR